MAYDKIVDSAVLDAGLTATANAIRGKTGDSALIEWKNADGFKAAVDAIASLEGGTGVEPIKAFYTQPLVDDIQVKNIAPLPPYFTYVSNYTNSANTISVEFPYGDVGDRHILAFAIRKPSGEPVLPNGWTKIAWILSDENSSSKQCLLVASLITDENNAGGTGQIAFDITSGERNYLMVINIRGCDVDTSKSNVKVASNVSAIEVEPYEHTLLICTSETTAGIGQAYNVWEIAGGGFIEKHCPYHSDGSFNGGRLSAIYVPHLSQQPFSKINLAPFTGGTGDGRTSGVIVCALNIMPMVVDRYEACLDGEEITAAQALNIVLGGES